MVELYFRCDDYGGKHWVPVSQHCCTAVSWLHGVVLPVPNTYHRHIHHPHRPHSLVLRKSQPKSLYHPELEAILMLGATVWGSTYEVLHALQGLPKQLNSVTAFFPIFGSLGIFPRNRNLNIILRIHMLGISSPHSESPQCAHFSLERKFHEYVDSELIITTRY